MYVSNDGSVLKKSLLFREYLPQYIEQYLPGRTVRFVTTENATLVGTTAGALTN